jgi:hypothetical protein
LYSSSCRDWLLRGGTIRANHFQREFNLAAKRTDNNYPWQRVWLDIAKDAEFGRFSGYN